MSPSPKMNFLQGLVICHGKSEWQMSRYISTNLHLNIKSYAKNQGKHSIQITSLMSILNSKPFSNISSFAAEYSVEVKGKGSAKILQNFQMFIIMDTDDCTEAQKQDFISKKMFQDHWLYDYIIPIYSIKSLEDVLLDSGIMVRRIGNKEKGTYYARIFPINTKPLCDDTILEIHTLKKQLSKSKRSNLTEFIDYCLSLVKK